MAPVVLEKKTNHQTECMDTPDLLIATFHFMVVAH
jgi:hypothetical protein